MQSNAESRRVLRYWGSHIQRAGQVRGWIALSEILSSRGWKMTLVRERPCQDVNVEAQFEAAGIDSSFIPRPRGRLDTKVIRQMYELCKLTKPDLVHCDNIHLSPLLGALLAGKSKRLWYKRAMMSAFEECRQSTFKDQLVPSARVSAAISHAVVCVSDAVEGELHALRIARNKSHVIENPRDHKGTYSENSRLQVREELGIDSGKTVGMTIGHAVPVKGWDILAQSLLDVLSDDEDSVFIFCGSVNDDHERQCYRQVHKVLEQFCATGRVLFTGRIEDVSGYLSAADYFVLPSLSEGSSNALIEALNSGLPTVTTDVGNARKFRMGGPNYRLVERGNVSALTQEMRGIIAASRALTKRERPSLLPDWVPTKVEHMHLLIDVYDELLGDGLGASRKRRDGSGHHAGR